MYYISDGTGCIKTVLVTGHRIESVNSSHIPISVVLGLAWG